MIPQGDVDELIAAGLNGWPNGAAARDRFATDYEVLREVWSQYHGLIIGRIREADTDGERDALTGERDQALRVLAEIVPQNNDRVRALLDDWSSRVAELRG